MVFFGEVKALHLAENKYCPWGFPKVEITGGTPRNIARELERPRRGISRPIYGQVLATIFKMWVDTRFCLFLALL